MIKCPRNAKALPLSAGNAHAAVADGRVKPLRQSSDKIRKLRLLECLPNTAVVNLLVGDAKRYVISDRLVHQIDGLRNVANLGKPCRVVVKDIVTVTGDTALPDLQKSKQNIHNRRLACAGRSHNPDRLTARHHHVCMVKN